MYSFLFIMIKEAFEGTQNHLKNKRLKYKSYEPVKELRQNIPRNQKATNEIDSEKGRKTPAKRQKQKPRNRKDKKEEHIKPTS